MRSTFLTALVIVSLLAAAVVFAADAPSVATDDPHVFRLSDEQLEKCHEQGGCFIISAQRAQEILEATADVRAAKVLCGSRVVRYQ